MKIYLNQEEINAAVAAYVPQLGIDVTGKDVEVNLDVDDDGEALVVVVIEPHTDEPKPTTVRRRRRSKAEIAAANKAEPKQAELFEDTLPDDQAICMDVEPAVLVKKVEPMTAKEEEEILESVAVKDEPETPEQVNKTTSLFG